MKNHEADSKNVVPAKIEFRGTHESHPTAWELIEITRFNRYTTLCPYRASQNFCARELGKISLALNCKQAIIKNDTKSKISLKSLKLKRKILKLNKNQIKYRCASVKIIY